MSPLDDKLFKEVMDFACQSSPSEYAALKQALSAIVAWREEHPDVLLPTPLTCLIEAAKLINANQG